MDSDMLTDITLDHLPDLSDASLSFQIPAHIESADLLHTDDLHLLANAEDDDPSFASLPRGPPLTLSELTPRVHPTSYLPPRSPTPTPLPSSSAKPSVIASPLTFPSRERSIHRRLVSEDRLDLLRAQVATLGHADDAPAHVHVHVIQPAQDGDRSLECPPNSNSNLPNSPPGSEDPNLSDQDVAMHTRDNAPAHANNLVPHPSLHRNPRTTVKPTILARPVRPTAHVSKKRKNNFVRSKEADNILPSAPRQLTPPQSIATDTVQERVPPVSMGGNTDVNSENTQIAQLGAGGVAQRLVSYSQKMISSIGLYKHSSESSFTEVSNDAVKVADVRIRTHISAAPLAPSSPPRPIHDIPSARNEPFRLSEISPHKPPANALHPNSPAYTGAPQHGGHAVSPMRPAKKRLSMDADLRQQNHRRKRGKIAPADDDSGRGSPEEAISQDHIHAHAERAAIVSETRDVSMPRPDSILPSARTKYKPRLNISIQCKGPTLDAFPYLSRSRQVRESTNKDKDKRDEGHRKIKRSTLERRDKKRRGGNALRSTRARQHSGPTSTGDLPLIEKKQNATLCVASLTKPAGFTFRVDARLEARKREETRHGLAASEPWKTYPDAVPESQAPARPLLASHPCASASTSTFAFHSRNHDPYTNHHLKPVVPFIFSTEQRAKEREKFDAMVKRKEEEMQRLKEERRRQEAEEEALAIRELRRKAVPKANDVPEWYVDMPKKKGTLPVV